MAAVSKVAVTATASAAKAWAATLRLPRSRFPARPAAADRSRYVRRACDELYAWQRQQQRQRREFVLHDGPPYANGALHVGHALNKILKDLVCRTRLAAGHPIRYVPGWDCHGLPIELKALQLRPDLLGNAEATESAAGGAGAGANPSAGRAARAVRTRAAARDLAARTVQEQMDGFRAWAVMADWDAAWKSMDPGFELAQLEVFRAMLARGLIFQSLKPVFWSPASQTALAEAELEYNPEHKSRAAFVKFTLASLPDQMHGLLKDIPGPVHAAVWTTTPWTLPANRALAVNEAMEYFVVRSEKHGNLIVSTSRLAELEKVCEEQLAPLTRPFMGQALVGAKYERSPPGEAADVKEIFHADFVTDDSGTGIVHMAPGHGGEDYKLCQTLGIEPYAPVDDSGKFHAEMLSRDLQSLGGKEVVTDGNIAVLQLLKAQGALIKSHSYTHSYPYDWRSKKPVIVRATKQWFAKVDGIREASMQSLEEVTFIPESGKDRLSSFIRNRSEWCISRQRAWGVPIPALYNTEDGSTLMTPESVAHIIDVIRQRGIDAWWTDGDLDQTWVPPSFRNKGAYRRGQDTLDVWFDSGTSWTQTVDETTGKPKQADLYVEGTDQHRGWFQSSLLTKIASAPSSATERPEAPFKTLITHGFTLDKDGRKMSKSIGNVISPAEIIEGTLLPPLKRKSKSKPSNEHEGPIYDAMGPDALRMWVASCDYTRDVVISEPVLKAVNSHMAKLRVTFKLLTALLDTHDAAQGVAFEQLDLANKAVLIKLHQLQSAVDTHFAAHEYHKATSAINNFVAADFSAVYVEAIKDRMYADATHSAFRVHTQAVLWEVFQGLTKMLAPITPLLVEEALEYLPAQLQTFHPLKAPGMPDASGVVGPWRDAEVEKLLPQLTAIGAAVKAMQEQARNEKRMGSSLQSFVTLQFQPGSQNMTALERHKSELEDLLVVSRLELSSSPSEIAGDTWSYATTCETEGEDVRVVVHQPTDDKCVRCWKYTVPTQSELEAALCHRCVGVLEGLRDENPSTFEDMPKLDSHARSCREDGDLEYNRHWNFGTHSAALAKDIGPGDQEKA